MDSDVGWKSGGREWGFRFSETCLVMYLMNHFMKSNSLQSYSLHHFAADMI